MPPPRRAGGADARAARRGRTPGARGACARRPRRWRPRRRGRRGRRASRGPARRVGYGAVADASLDEAVATAATGDLWLFRGRSLADRAIQAVTNSPVNHVGHGRRARRPAAAAVARRARPLAARRVERAAPARRPAAQAARRRDDLERALRPARVGAPARGDDRARARGPPDEGDRRASTAGRSPPRSVSRATGSTGARAPPRSSLEAVYCAELVATTYQHMGLLPSRRPASWYDPGRFWSGDRIELVPPFALGGEVAVATLRRRAPVDPAPWPSTTSCASTASRARAPTRRTRARSPSRASPGARQTARRRRRAAAARGKVSIQDLHVTAPTSKAGPLLLLACASARTSRARC